MIKKLIGISVVLLLFISIAFLGYKSVKPGLNLNSNTKMKESSQKPEKDQLVFRLADYWGDDHPAVQGDKEFARLVYERSKGKIKIIVYSNALLGDEKPVVEQVQLGGIDFARVNSAPLSSISGKLSVLSLPYLFRDSSHLWNVLSGPIGDEILNSLKEGKLLGLAYYDSGARSFYTKKPIKSISDLINLRIRVQQSEIFESFIKLLPSIPVKLDFGYVYNSLQKDEIDGAENNWSSYILSNHYKLAKYYILDEHTRNPEVLIVNDKLMNSLDKKYQDIILKAAKESTIFQRKVWDLQEKKSEELIRESGNTVIKLTPKERKFLESKITPLYYKYGKDYKTLIERIKNTK